MAERLIREHIEGAGRKRPQAPPQVVQAGGPDIIPIQADKGLTLRVMLEGGEARVSEDTTDHLFVGPQGISLHGSGALIFNSGPFLQDAIVLNETTRVPFAWPAFFCALGITQWTHIEFLETEPWMAINKDAALEIVEEAKKKELFTQAKIDELVLARAQSDVNGSGKSEEDSTS
jgi:hypothetical protein